MALTGRLLADFSEFHAAVQKAEVELRGMETGAAKVEKSLNRMTDGFSGRKIIQDATLAAEAVERIGGASKLTEAEQARVNRTVTEAIAKYQALGKEAPTALTDLATATKRVDDAAGKATKSTTDWKGALLGAAGALGLAFSAQALVGFIGRTIEAGGRIDDLSKKLGVSAEAVQRWEYAAKLAGSSLETVDRAVGFMNKTLAGGGSSMVEALRLAGLEFSTIRAMAPEDAFNAITEAIAGVEDPMTRAQVATALFGRSGQELLPGIVAGFDKVAKGASVMSDETIKRLDEAGDAWERLWNRVTVASGEVIAFLAQDAPENSYLKQTERDAEAARAEVQTLIGWFDVLRGKIETMPTVKAPNLAGAGPTAPTFDITELLAQGEKLDAQIKARTDSTVKAAKATLDLAAAEKARLDQMTGTVAIEKALATARDVGLAMSQRGIELAEMTKGTQAAINKTMGEAIDVYRTLGQEVPPEILAIYKATADLSFVTQGLPKYVAGLSAEYRSLFAVAKPVLPEMVLEAQRFAAEAQKITDGLKDITSWLPKVAAEATGRFARMGDDFEQVGLQLGADISSFLGEGVRSGDWSQFENQMKEAFAQAMGSAVAAGVNLLVPGLGTAMQPLFSAISDTILGAFGLGTAGRDLVKEFAASFGGFDALREELNVLGSEGEHLWRALTQGVGRNNPQEALAAIQRITDALSGGTGNAGALASIMGYQTQAELQSIADTAEKVYAHMLASGQYTASELSRAFDAMKDAQVAAMGEADAALAARMTAASDAIKKLQGEYDSLAQSIANEAPEEVMGIIEAQTRGRMAQIESERTALELQMEAAAAAAAEVNALIAADAKDLDAELRTLFGEPMRIPYYFEALNAPESGVQPGTGTVSPFVRPGGGASVRGGDTEITLVMPDGEVLLRQVVKARTRGRL